MPTSPRKAKKILREGEATVIKRKPFTIRLNHATGETTQEITLGIDTGYKNVGFSAVSENKELIDGEITLRTDIPKKMEQRASYRNTRRSRLWHRPPRFLNRKKEAGWLAPSIQHKMDAHIRIVEQIMKLMPVTNIMVEVAKFDIQKIKNPDVEGTGYQEGEQMGFWNVREYVLHRDNHKCQHCKGKLKDPILQVHHVHGKKNGATDRPEELITVCMTCHKNHHNGVSIIPEKEIKRFKPETFMSMVRWKILNELRERFENINHTYGHITKTNRIRNHLPKTHANDAFTIAKGGKQERCQTFDVIQVRRNNRCLQRNRKGYAPSIRRTRYENQPHDLVEYENRLYTSGGSMSYGKYIYLKINGKKKSVRSDGVKLIKHQKGFCYR